jgi:hypothetical protein
MADGYSFSAPAVPKEDVLASLSGIVYSVAQAKLARPGERNAGMWDFTVPKSRRMVDLIRAYAAQNCILTLLANGVNVGSVRLDSEPPRVVSSNLLVKARYSLFGNEEVAKELLLPIPDSRTIGLLQGQWVALGAARIRLGSVLPEITSEGETAVLRWTDPPSLELGSTGLFGLMRKITRTRLSELRLGPDYGEFTASGLTGWILPRLKWA